MPPPPVLSALSRPELEALLVELFGDVAALKQGNLSNVKPAGEGVLEYRINWGPGYRVYFGRDGDVLVILLTGGTKKRQQRDIDTATALWSGYKRRRPRTR